MIKISKIKKILLLLIVSMVCFLSSCNNKYTIMEEGVTLEVSKSAQKYFVNTSLPTLHFDYNGVKVMIESDGAACYFVQNDQYELSDKFSEHLKKYTKEQIYLVASVNQEYDEGSAKFGSDSLKLDELDEFGNEQKYSKEYQIVAVNNDGTRYSYQFRSFVSNSKRYFIYRFTSNMGISMEQPVMVIDGEKENKLVLVALPFDTKYEVSLTNIDQKSLIKKDNYTKERYQKFAYPDSIKDNAESVRQEMVKSWYTTYCNGYTKDNEFFFEYYGAKFKVTFGIKDAGNEQNKEGFKLEYIG